MKQIVETNIPGVYELEFFHAGDDRGMFVKPFHASTLATHGLETNFKESFYSTNQRGVIRGMHFQFPPHDHAKIVYCTQGSLTDVILDLRLGSPTYGKHVSIELSGNNFKGVYLPKGVAHGFAVHEDKTCMIYLTSTEHAPDYDGGIHIHSFGFDWPFQDPICSERDQQFISLEDFQSPFVFT